MVIDIVEVVGLLCVILYCIEWGELLVMIGVYLGVLDVVGLCLDVQDLMVFIDIVILVVIKLFDYLVFQ